MGMDYCWSGSASYHRFEEEREAVAKVLGGNKILLADGPCFAFPEDTNPVLTRWLKEPYGDYTLKETKTIWSIVQQHPEIEEISWQIWNELKTCCELDTAWYIY